MKRAIYTINTFIMAVLMYVCDAVIGVAIPTQIAMVIVKACNFGAFASMGWGDPLLWIPVMVFAVAIPTSIISGFLACLSREVALNG